MEFDVSKVYTAVNADELKVGSEVYLADSVHTLKLKVENDRGWTTLSSVAPPNESHRFVGANSMEYILAYLIEEPKQEQEKYRVYESINEMTEDLGIAHPIGLIIKSKVSGSFYSITGYDTDDNDVLINTEWIDLFRLCKDYCTVDGRVLGIKSSV